MGNISGFNVDCNLCQLSIATIRFKISSIRIWIVRCIKSCSMGDSLVLYYFCMRSQFGWSGKLVFVTSVMATDFQIMLFNLFTTFSSAYAHNGHNKNVTLFHRNNRSKCQLLDNFISRRKLNTNFMFAVSSFYWKLCANSLRSNNRNTCI